MNKQGMLLPEQVVKIVIALISLTFLIYLLTALYFSGSNLENEIKADNFTKGTHGSLKLAIEKVDSSGESETLFEPNVPNGWYLYSFVGDSEKPTPCEKKNCLCVCETAYFSGRLSECNEKGSCLIVENLINEEIAIKLTVRPSVDLEISKVQDKYIKVVKK